MIIVQLVGSISYGDAVGNDILAMRSVIEEMGYETAIYAENIDKRLPEGTAYHKDKMPELAEDDVAIYHMACGCDMSAEFAALKCKRVMVYHNITPPHFFRDYDKNSYKVCQDGYEQLKLLADKTDYCLAVSEYNKSDLIRMGFQCKIDVLPIIIPYEDYDKEPAQKTFDTYQDGKVNILFVGRVVPNKKHEDVIKAFYEYQRHYNLNSRLIFVGSSAPHDRYRQRLDDYAKELGVENLVFPGHIKFDEILAFYRLADVFLCQSEHEGFCVPLIEAMYLGTPIIAYDASAIAGTLGGSGILMDTKSPLITAGMINELVTNEELKQTVLDNQKERLKDFDRQLVKNQFKQYLQENVL